MFEVCKLLNQNKKFFELVNQDDKILGAFSKCEDALKAAKILSKENQKIYLKTCGYRNSLLGMWSFTGIEEIN